MLLHKNSHEDSTTTEPLLGFGAYSSPAILHSLSDSALQLAQDSFEPPSFQIKKSNPISLSDMGLPVPQFHHITSSFISLLPFPIMQPILDETTPVSLTDLLQYFSCFDAHPEISIPYSTHTIIPQSMDFTASGG